MSPDAGVTVLAALRLEAVVIGGEVVRTGMGHARAGATGARLAQSLGPDSRWSSSVSPGASSRPPTGPAGGGRLPARP